MGNAPQAEEKGQQQESSPGHPSRHLHRTPQHQCAQFLGKNPESPNPHPLAPAVLPTGDVAEKNLLELDGVGVLSRAPALPQPARNTFSASPPGDALIVLLYPVLPTGDPRSALLPPSNPDPDRILLGVPAGDRGRDVPLPPEEGFSQFAGKIFCYDKNGSYNILQIVSNSFRPINNYKAFVFRQIYWEHNITSQTWLQAWHQLRNMPQLRCEINSCQDCSRNDPNTNTCLDRM
ncbi:hypothetical protein UY3_14239 [Chelonia mydas]|uniref:Uncharacterized protein n=1 Tax=Chelonia mydas TaxID=8469 RepID=M7AVA6_CHEMY|nr:hypothetical protein UY3_14239 [Chelonia mydas]